MRTTKLFEVLAARGQKQRWLLGQLRERGYRFSETYLSQVKSGGKAPSRRFIEAVCATLGLPEEEMFEGGGDAGLPGMAEEVDMPKTNKTKKKGPINVAIIGLGNCASSLIQGVHYYRDAREGESVPGLMHVSLAGYHVRDINFVAGIDIDVNKVGKDLSEAIFAPPNNTFKFTDVPATGVRVSRGMVHDGVGKYLQDIVHKAPGSTDDIVRILRETETHVVVNYLPVGSEEATKWYVEQVLTAGW